MPIDDTYENAREHFFEAIRAMAASAEPIQDRLTGALLHIVKVTIDEFEGDIEMKTKFARILDTLSVDQGEIEAVGIENAAHMSDEAACAAASAICDFFYDLG